MKDSVDIFLFMGQSNMAGRGVPCAAFPEGAPAATPGAGFEYRAVSAPHRLSPLTEPFGVRENRPGGIDDGGMKTGSLVTAFVNAYYAAAGVPVVGISASKGGSALAQWQPGAPDGFLADALQRLADCRAFLAAHKITVRHTFVLWCQGETDGDLGTDKAVYCRQFDTMLAALQNAGVERLFMLQIGECNIPGAELRYRPIRQWQTELAASRDAVTMVCTALAGMRARGLMKDDFHYYQAAYNEVGTLSGWAAGQAVARG